MDTGNDALLVTGVVDTRHVPLDQLASEETATVSCPPSMTPSTRPGSLPA